MVQSLYKNLLLVSKITGVGTTSEKQWRAQKVEIRWDTFVQKIHSSKKYIPSAKTCTEDLSNITFNYLSENSPNYLRHFLNHKSFFTTQRVCIFLTQTLHTFYKSCPSKFKFSDFPLLALKFTKFLMSFFKQEVSFSSRFGSFFNVIGDNTSMLFQQKLYLLLTKVTHQRVNFRTCYCSH